MPRWACFLVLCTLFVAHGRRSHAAPAGAESLITGTVTATRAAWSADGRRIVTTTTVTTASGPVELRQLGGSEGGIGMVVIHGPAIPAVGQAITARVGPAPASATTTTAGPDNWIRELRAGHLAPGASITELPRMEFTRTRAEKSLAPLRWKSGCVFVSFAAEGTSDIPGDTEFAVLESSVDEWVSETRSCGYLSIVIDGLVDSEVGFDRLNLVKFRDEVWGRPAVGDAEAELYQAEAGGLTTLFFVDEQCPDGSPPCPDTGNPRNGEILDADIEINAVNFAVSVNGDTSGSASCLSDLANTFTHELGHLIGLDHTCYPSGGGIPPLGEDGQPVPSCDGNLPGEITEATMFNFQDCGETKKASLEADDIEGFCAIYPLSADPGTCEPVGEEAGCCSVARHSSPRAPLVLTLLSSLAWMLLGQRRRVRHRS